MSTKVASKKQSSAKKEDIPTRTEKIQGPKKESPKKEAAIPSVTVKKEEEQTLCVIRIRGGHGMKRSILKTLHLLKLYRVNHATIVRTTPSIKGMLQKAKDYIAFGPINSETLKKLMKKRASLEGNLPLLDSHVASQTVYKSVDELAQAIYDGKIKLKEVKNLKPVFRLHPPLGGYKGSVKKSYHAGGILGNMGEKINYYLKRMI